MGGEEIEGRGVVSCNKGITVLSLGRRGRSEAARRFKCNFQDGVGKMGGQILKGKIETQCSQWHRMDRQGQRRMRGAVRLQ
jgi:hypothetical protein